MCHKNFGVHTVPLSYVIRDVADATLVSILDTAVTYNTYLPSNAHGESGSILENLIHRDPHTHPLLKWDNANVFTIIEIAVHGTHFSNTIQPIKRGNNGQGAWIVLLASHVGEDKWEKIAKTNSYWLMSALRKGDTSDLATSFKQFLGTI